MADTTSDLRARARLRERWETCRTILSDPSVIARVDEAGEFLARCKKSELREHVIDYGTRVAPLESPIEVIFFAWWAAFEALMEDENSVVHLSLWPQRDVTVGGELFRLDFSVSLRESDDFPNIAIELDGHDFHEKTKEQVTYRNHRDRILQQHGWRVFHVSGSELFRDAEAVVGEIHQHCSTEAWRLVNRRMKA